jgi:hypothetical protein
MLSEDWKKEIVDAVNKADARNAERHEAQLTAQNAIAAPLNRLLDKVDCYISEQRRRENLAAFVAVVTAIIFYWQLQAFQSTDRAMHQTLDTQNSLLDLTTRAILTADFDKWQISPTPLAAGKSPIIAFELRNVGKMNAHILRATYEYAVAGRPPIKFSPIKPIAGVAAMLGPGVQTPIIISDLNQLSPDSIKSIGEGREFIWLRTIFDYRDDRSTLFEIRFTGRYGQSIASNGENISRFTFPDAEVPSDRWHNIIGLRCLNMIGSFADNPEELGCKEQ